jgi:uncharacterized surface protein with fasciclin (FAS1) repeats
MKSSNLFPVALAGAAVAQNSSASLVDAIGEHDSLSVLGELLSNYTEILDILSELSNVTILAPENAALEGFLEDWDESDVGLLTAILSYHVLNGTYFSDNVTDTPAFIPTLLSNETYTNVTDGQVVEVVSSGDNVTFYSALRQQSNVTQADIEFEGGVIHIIGEVLTIPGNLTETAIEGSLAAVAGALNFTSLATEIEGLEDVTIFAPNNDAFAAIANLVGNLTEEDLSSILEYHVVQGDVWYSSDLSNTTVETIGGEELNITVLEDGSVYVDSARVVLADILIANGVVHVINNVLNPNATDNEPNPSTTTPAFAGASTATDGGVPFTTGIPEPTATGDDTSDLNDGENTEDAAPRATAAIAMGALFGGAAMLLNI